MSRGLQRANRDRCRCRAEFCYLCGKPWKTCDCKLWDEAQLVNNAAEWEVNNAVQWDVHNEAEWEVDPEPVRNVEPVAVPVQPRSRQEILRMTELERARIQNRCLHPEWQLVNSSGINTLCAYCHSTRLRYIPECIYCRIKVCVKCRQRRLRNGLWHT